MTFSLLFGFHLALQVSDILLLHPSLLNSFCLGPRFHESPTDLISCEVNRIPFVSQDIDLDSWADSFCAWPNPPEGWVSWYNRMTPTLMDVVMITGLDIASPNPSTYNLLEVPFRLSSKSECTNWGAYLSQYVKTKGPMTEGEHTTFLNFWLEHFIFCGPSLAPTKNYLSLAYKLAQGATVGLGKLFLREVYRYRYLMSSSLLSQKRLETGGPWWFIQLWAHLYFQSYIPNFSVLADNSFPDQTRRCIRCTSYGQALYSLPGSKLNLKDASGWFRVF
jgi:hypothetical protein